MAIFHLSIKNISRGDGRSAVAAAAYRAGETLPNEAEERDSAFGGKRDVIFSEIRVPDGGAPWMIERARLWNEVEKAEIRKDARLSKEIVVAIPVECAPNQWVRLIRQLADRYVAAGHVVDFAIHDDGSRRNPHAHLLLTTRVVTENGFGPKLRDADGKKFVLDARKMWAGIVNTTFAEMGLSLTIDHRSHKAAGSQRPPSSHRGPDPEARQARREQMKERTVEEMRQHIREADSSPGKRSVPVIDAIEHNETLEIDFQRGNAALDDDPVPDPDGNLIHPRELAAAEKRMLDEMHRDGEAEAGPGGDIETARTAVDRQNALEMSEDEAAAYRLAPENMLDWLEDARVPETPEDLKTLERWENHLDWLDTGDGRSEAPANEREGYEPDRHSR